MVLQARQKMRCESKRKETPQQVGDQVLVFRPTGKKRRSEKLLHQFHGPYIVLKKPSNLTYAIRLPGRRNVLAETVHLSRMKPFEPRGSEGTPPQSSVQPENSLRRRMPIFGIGLKHLSLLKWNEKSIPETSVAQELHDPRPQRACS